MFTELYAVARHTALTMIVTPRGELLRITIIPKPEGDVDAKSALTKPLQIEGTPAELDADLPAEIARYCGKANELRVKLDLPIDAIDAEIAKPGKTKRSAPEKKTAAAKPKKEKKAAAPKRPAAPRKAAKKATATPRRPAAPSASAKSKPAKRGAPVPRSSLPGKDKCVEDLRAYIATGKSLTRAAFIGWARKNGNKTGRRYEKLWTNWDAFIAEGNQLGLELTDASTGVEQLAKDLSETTYASARPAAWPFPTHSTEPEAPREPAEANPAAGHTLVEDADASGTAPKPADEKPAPAPESAETEPPVRQASTGDGLGALLDDVEARLRSEGHLKQAAAPAEKTE